MNKKVLAALAALLVALAAALVVSMSGVSFTTSMSQADIQAKLDSGIPRRNEVQGGVLHVRRADIGFTETGDRLRLLLTLEYEPSIPAPPGPPPLPGPPGLPGPGPGAGHAPPKAIAVDAELTGLLDYDPPSGQIVLRSLQLGRYGGDALPEPVREPVRRVVSEVIGKELEGKAISTLDPGSTARKVLHRLWVEQDRLWISLKIGG